MPTGHGWQVPLLDHGHGFSLAGSETDTQGVALGTNGYLRVTRNGGTSWRRITVLTDPRCGPLPTRAASVRVTHEPPSSAR